MDYEKKYKEALEKAQRFYNNSVAITNKGLEDIFPELKESENIKIIKAIKYGLDYVFTNNTTVFEVTEEQCLSWLEKQGEHSNFLSKIQVGDKVTRNQDGVLVNQSQLKRVAKKDEKQGEQKQELLTKEKALKNSPFVEQKSADKVEPKFKVGDIIKPKCYNETHSIKAIGERYYILDVDIKIPFRDEDEWELVEHKNTWSEEDEKCLENAIMYCEWARDIAPNLYCYETSEKSINWLKSFKDRVQPQPKQEWSEEDEQTFIKSVEALEDFGKFELADWLKEHKNQFLKPQNTWKPSELQIAYLSKVIFTLGNEGDCATAAELRELRDNLEMLKEK